MSHDRRWRDLLVHRDGDLTATVQARECRCRVSTPRWRRAGSGCRWTRAFAGATIGGMLATNDSGPLRHRFGTPRDLLIGITLALTDGRVVKAGGTVVKNVAGYDLGKLVTGSFGALAAIVDATFKLLPLPQASATLRAVVRRSGARWPPMPSRSRRGSSSRSPSTSGPRGTPEGPRWSLFVRFASSPAAVASQLEAARALLRGDTTALRDGHGDARLGRAGRRCRGTATGAVMRCSWLPSRLGRGAGARGRRCGERREVALAARVVTGAGWCG